MASILASMKRSRIENAATLRRERHGQVRMATAEAQLLDLHQQLTDATARAAQAAQAEQQRVEAAGRLEQADKQAIEAQQQLARAEQEAASLEGQLRSANGKAQKHKIQIAGARRQIAQLLESSSWRLTAPLRAMKRLLTPRTRRYQR